VFSRRAARIVRFTPTTEPWERRIDDLRTPIRIVVADEHALFREAVRVVLEAEPDLHVVGDVSDGIQAAIEARRSKPDCVLLDSGLSSRDGVSATRRIKEDVPECRVLVLAGEEDQEALIEALEAGASGYLTKESPLEELIDAVRAVYRGETLVPPRMLGGLVSGLIRRREDQEEALRRMSRLTRREREVLGLLARGFIDVRRSCARRRGITSLRACRGCARAHTLSEPRGGPVWPRRSPRPAPSAESQRGS
jgi:DNA-binding NarL/FixJ family response regulator